MYKFLFFKRKPNKLFLLYFTSIFLLILVPVLFLSLSSYRLAYTSIVKEIRNADYNALQQTRSSMDRLLEDLLTSSIQLGLDGRIFAASENENSSFLLNDVKDRITSFANENGFIQSIQLYFFNSGLIISSDGPNRTTPIHPQDQWISAMRASEQTMLWLPTRTYVNHDGNAYDIASVMVTLPVAFPKATGYAAIHFYEDKLNQYLRDMDPDRNSLVYLVAPDGTIISGYAFDDRQDTLSRESVLKLLEAGEAPVSERYLGSDALVTVSDRLSNDWRLISITPLDYVKQKMRHVQNLILLTGILLIAFGAAVSYLLSRTMYNPIKALLDKIKKHQKEFSISSELHNEGQSLTDATSVVEQVFQRHSKLESLYRTNHEGMVDRFLYHLFFNRSNLSEEDIKRQIADLGLPITTAGYVVMLLEVDDYAKWKEHYSIKDLNLLRYAAKNIAQEILAKICPCLAVEINDNQTAVLMNIGAENIGDESEDSMLSEAAEAVIHAVRTYLPFTVTAAFGPKVAHILQAHISFSQVQEVMRHKLVLHGMSVLFPEQISKRDIFERFYPVHLERALINYLRAGKEAEAIGCLEKMREELVHKPNLSYDNVFRMYNRLIDAIIDMVNDAGEQWPVVYGAGSVYKELTQQDSIESIHGYVSNVLFKVCHAMEKLNRTPVRIEAALAYISEHYQEDISVEQIANEVQLNPAYLSRLFKQTVGKTVLEHLAMVRMNESKRLLNETSLTVQELAVRVGYNNTTSFIRFFRKYEGVTPGEYRKLHNQGKSVD